MCFRKKNKSPPVLSHEFVIQNHADMVSCVAMVILLGLMFEVTAKFANVFITLQYNVTQSLGGICNKSYFLMGGLSTHQHGVKFFYICQMAYWLHALPELYFQKDIPRQLYYICLYVFLITGAYVLNFTLWPLLFIIARLLTLSVLTFGFGLPRAENQGFSLAEGNFNVLTVRQVVFLKDDMPGCHLPHPGLDDVEVHQPSAEEVEGAQPEPGSQGEAVSPKSKPHKKDPAQGGSANGVLMSDD
ncbi:unnamed protein product [Coregonus sp. 'balchen']|nr:unnamed protein product [Coregonus sp. 'balchen']